MAEGDREVPETIGKLMCEIRDRLKLLESALETRVDAMVSPDSKLPNNVWACRTSLAWRMMELSRSHGGLPRRRFRQHPTGQEWRGAVGIRPGFCGPSCQSCRKPPIKSVTCDKSVVQRRHFCPNSLDALQ